MGAQRATRAFQLYAARRARDTLFGEAAEAFGEPAWDMLLMLYIHDMSGQPITRGDLLGAAGVSCVIAVRYLDWMVSRELATVDQDDLVQLLDLGRTRMNAYFDQGEH